MITRYFPAQGLTVIKNNYNLKEQMHARNLKKIISDTMEELNNMERQTKINSGLILGANTDDKTPAKKRIYSRMYVTSPPRAESNEKNKELVTSPKNEPSMNEEFQIYSKEDKEVMTTRMKILESMKRRREENKTKPSV